MFAPSIVHKHVHIYLKKRGSIDFTSFDVSAGLGYNYMLGDNIGLESNLDYYIKSESAAFRFGVALFL